MEASRHWQGRRVLITGGLGFIGSNLAIALVERGADVVLLDSMIPAYGGNLHNIDPIRDRVRTNFSDVRDVHALDYVLQGQDVIFSLAGQLSHIASMRDPATDLDINCRSQLSLLETCRAKNPRAKIVFASTRQLYGRPRYLPVDESHPIDPVDVNGINNLAAELYYGLYHRVYGLRTVSLRLTNTYGPRMDLRSDEKGFVGIFVRKALRGEPIPVYGSGEQRRDFNYVDDVVAALLLAAASDTLDGRVFNLGHASVYSLNQFVAQLGRLERFESSHIAFPSDRAAIDIGDYYGSFDRFREATGWEPRVDLEEGLARTLAFFREHCAHYL